MFIFLNLNLGAENMYFLKTLDGEEFPKNLTPSLESNVSYILAYSNTSASQITYQIDSKLFTVNSNGQVFLIAYLDDEATNSITYKHLTITASTLLTSAISNTTISIVDVNDRPPVLSTSRRIFEIVEGNQVPTLISFNHLPIEISFHDPDPSNTDVFVACENTLDHPDVCSFFSFNKIVNKSTRSDWFGTIQVHRKLNYLEKSVYQLVAVVQDNMANTKRYVFEIRVLANFNEAPVLSSDSYTCVVAEKEMSTSRIGKLAIPVEYDYSVSASVVFQLVPSYQELLNAGISAQAFADVDFELVRNYFRVNSDNELLSISFVDRDSFVFSSINGHVKLWVRGFFKKNPNNINYFKVSVLLSFFIISLKLN